MITQITLSITPDEALPSSVLVEFQELAKKQGVPADELLTKLIKDYVSQPPKQEDPS